MRQRRAQRTYISHTAFQSQWTWTNIVIPNTNNDYLDRQNIISVNRFDIFWRLETQKGGVGSNSWVNMKMQHPSWGSKYTHGKSILLPSMFWFQRRLSGYTFANIRTTVSHLRSTSVHKTVNILYGQTPFFLNVKNIITPSSEQWAHTLRQQYKQPF